MKTDGISIKKDVYKIDWDIEADDVLCTWAGLEIAVAYTKVYTTQLVALAIVAMYLAEKRGMMSINHVIWQRVLPWNR